MTFGMMLIALLFAPSLEDPFGMPAEEAVQALVKDPVLRGLDTGISVRCTEDAVEWGGYEAKRRFNPASGAKLLSTASALELLKPEFRTSTRAFGKVEGGAIQSLTIVAGGDPSLTMEDLTTLAQGIAAHGKRVQGPLVVDTSIFPDGATPPAFDTKRSDAGYRPQVPAFGIQSGAFFVTVSPGKSVGAPVRVTTSLVANSLKITQDATTVAGKGIGQLQIHARMAEGGVTHVVVSGKLGVDAGPQGVKKRLADPARTAADQLIRILRREGVEIGAQVEIVSEATGAASRLTELARVESDPLAVDVLETNTTSNNYMAESIFKLIAAEDGVATWEEAAEMTTEILVKMGVDAEGLEVINGSGLYDGTKVSPAAMTQLLAIEAKETPEAIAFRESLAISGQTGTMRGRLHALRGQVYAKTGTLDNATSLSGYVPSERCLLAFSVIVNGSLGGKAGQVNRRIDAFVQRLSELQ